MMAKPYQFILGAAICAAWLSLDLATMAVRTFVLGQTLRSQLAEIQEEDAA